MILSFLWHQDDLVYACAHAFGVRAHVHVCECKHAWHPCSGELVISSCCTHSGALTQVAKLDSKHLCSLQHLPGATWKICRSLIIGVNVSAKEKVLGVPPTSLRATQTRNSKSDVKTSLCLPGLLKTQDKLSKLQEDGACFFLLDVFF